ncbi:MAG: hypothetical protein HIU84_08670 [Acidobacteria bacterium]|nr:hypothetical protein [Acidobacteriota bacterium]
MGTLVGLTAAALIVAALLALVLCGVAVVVSSVWTIRAERADRVFRADLDETLSEILASAAAAKV